MRVFAALSLVCVGGASAFVAPNAASSSSSSSRSASSRESSFLLRRPQRREAVAEEFTVLASENMFSRFARVVKSNVDSVLKGMEDPEKQIETIVGEMNNDLLKVRQNYAEIAASQKRVERNRDAAADQAKEWQRRAALAIQNSDEDLAREALARKQSLMNQVKTFEEEMRVQGDALGTLLKNMKVLEQKIGEAKRQKDQLIARARTAKTQQQVQDMLSGINSGVGKTSMDAFERMRQKVEELETKAEVSREMNNGPGLLEDRFAALESESDVEVELRQLKGQVAKQPAGERRYTVEFVDPAVEEELIALKRAASNKSA
uniref:PspA/IM30 family protein n=1 Tax=Chromera velia CCMP2878 TaxID=1169474 RepID=A0A0G4HRX6_9ALVE|eukprot:Cvel_8156.t1-p1 / transcript=Cvel_8156.t1 / gene=Cvel_8156 / organism=Chromera_velia_CCMP2878 / gene_product=Membrane-associated protein VIPP1, chloroplastic, putative / transcript_product=Membrane-associated protein VIPP1, chloroplastic, putative / location=Cvel_scaffold444:15766-19610(+) / protein_length=318 / sequence_SO=supercontig / SO=protein_coding / is_pseudo=false